MKFWILSLILVACFSCTLEARTPLRKQAVSVHVMFDPLFWKSELRLTRQQIVQIAAINTEFYIDLQGIMEQSRNSKVSLDQSKNLIEERGNKIWTVFSHRQKHKWQKIGYAYYEKQAPWNSLSALLERIAPRYAVQGSTLRNGKARNI